MADDIVDMNTQPWQMYVDFYTAVYYDIDYKHVGGNCSKWLMLHFGDDTLIDVHMDLIIEESVDPDTAEEMQRQSHFGAGHRIFPQRMNPATTPRLYAAKKSAEEVMAQNLLNLMQAAKAAVFFIITMPLQVIGNPTGGALRRPIARGSIPKLVQRGIHIAGFSPTESAVITEVRGMLSSQEMATLRAAQAAGRDCTVRIGGRYLQYDPNFTFAEAFADFEGNGFTLGPKAFRSEAEFTKTLLHETHRLVTSDIGRGALPAGASSMQDVVATETQAAFDFAERAFNAVFAGGK
jgi:hypothetical protein